VPRHPIVVRVELGAAVHRFQPKHKLRLLICSGAHPRVARNLGIVCKRTSMTGANCLVKGMLLFFCTISMSPEGKIPEQVKGRTARASGMVCGMSRAR
jgi:hypothetical protein